MEPLVGNQGIIVNPRYFYSRRHNIFDIFVEQIMLHRQYLGNQQDKSETIDHRHCQHIVEEVCGVKVVVGVSKWTPSSWYGAR